MVPEQLLALTNRHVFWGRSVSTVLRKSFYYKALHVDGYRYAYLGQYKSLFSVMGYFCSYYIFICSPFGKATPSSFGIQNKLESH